MNRALVLAAWLASAPTPGCAHDLPLPAEALRLNTAGALALASGDLATAEARLSVALEYSPRFVEAWVNLGYVELRRGSFEQSRRDLLRARALNPDLPAPHHALGVLAEARGDGLEAEEEYRAALAVDPGFGPARANLARRLFERGQYEDAREQYQRLRELRPAAPEGWAGEAESLLQLGREADAESALAAGRASAGDAPALRLVVARLRMMAGDWAGAEATLGPVTGDADRRRAAAAWAWIAVARLGRGEAEEAVEAARAALAISPSDPVARFALRASARR